MLRHKYIFFMNYNVLLLLRVIDSSVFFMDDIESLKCYGSGQHQRGEQYV